MYLRSLSIKGFKSFANKTTLRFEPGISVIVGPNGSGKSNITDAVLWALGEQRAKTLRGLSMEDVIFAGSASKQALGAAEVVINLNNSDGAIPIDYSEVSFSRRLFRSGDSEYKLNQTSCRLIDIQEILSDTGLGREMYSVISQGKLEDVLNCKPIDRRKLLEEAAGVLKHKRRKDRALRKLISMETNLARGKDLLKEVNRQLAPLQKQADQAGRHNELLKELKKVQIIVAVSKLKQLRFSWDSLNEETQSKTRTAQRLKTTIDEMHKNVSEIEKEIEEKGFLAGDIGEYRRRLEGLQERINSGLLLLEEKGKNLIAKLSEFRQSIYKYESAVQKDFAELERLNGQRLELDEEIGEEYKKLGEARRLAEIAKKNSKKAVGELSEVDSDVEGARAHAAKISGEKNRFESLKESTEEELSFLHEQVAAMQEKIIALEQELGDAKKEKEEVSKLMPRLNSEMTQAQLHVRKAEGLQTSTEKEIRDCVDQISTARATISAIGAVTESVGSDVPWKQEAGDKMPAIAGRVADLITTEKKYEKAIEIALGMDINALVPQNPDQVIDVFAMMKDKAQRSFRLLARIGSAKELGSRQGLKCAFDVVSCPKSYRDLISALLANVWISEDISLFIADPSKVPSGGVVVDLDGGYFDSRGLIAKQKEAADRAGQLGTKRELAELGQKEKQIAKTLEQLRKSGAEIEEELEDARKKVLDVSEQTRKVESKMMTVSLKVQSLEKEKDRVTSEKADIAVRMSQKKDGLKETEQKIVELSASYSFKITEIEKYDIDISNKRDVFTQRADDEKVAQAQLSEAQVLIASLSERQTHLKSRLLGLEDNLKQLKERLEQEKKRVEATEELRLRIQPVHDLYTELRLTGEGWASKLEKIAGDEQQEGVIMRKNLRESQQKLRDINADITSVNDELRNKEVTRAQVETEVNQITRHIVEELQIALETALEYNDEGKEPGEWLKTEERLQIEIDKIGPVNQIAATQFTSIAERQKFLSKQIDDLVRSQKALQKVVRVIDRKIRIRFKVTFDEVNTNFKEVFSELFEGGTAELVLLEDEVEDGRDPEDGVDIAAQPYGKRLQSLNLLSGGERSLVGLAFLFALHYTRPSPFYILDEVEAALDDANLQRFISLLKKLKKETQLLIITHQRRTMEAADCVYGVTMQSDGVSKVISQKLLLEDEIDERKTETEHVATTIPEPEPVSNKP